MVYRELEKWTYKMKQAALVAGLVATEEMVNSFRVESQRVLENGLETKIGLVGYARFRDLRSMNFARSPPVGAIRDWVEAKGLDKFSFVNGGKMSDSFAAADKIAWAIAKSKKQYPNVKRGYRGIYSRIVVSGMEDLVRKTLGITAKYGVKQVKMGFED